MATPSPPAPAAERSDPVLTAFRHGGRAAAAHPLLAALPFLATLTALGKLQRVAGASTSFQITFGLPTYVAGLWTFVNAPTPDGVTVFGSPPAAVLDRPAALAPRLALFAGGALLVGLLAAAYLGTLDRGLAGEPAAPLADVRTHAPVTVGFAALELVGLLVLGAVALVLPTPALIPLVLGSLVAVYLLGPVPYVGVAADRSLRESFAAGVDLATTSDWLLFVLAHAAVAAVCSPLVSGIAFADGLSAVLVAAAVAAPIGLVLNAATMAFVRDAVGESGHGGPVDRPSDRPREPTPAIRRVDDPKE